jgi:protein-tyrosine phosphatase
MVDSFSRFLVVCTGNICRSPLAEALLRRRLGARRIDAEVRSAGAGALVGEPADPMAKRLGAGLGVDLASHRGRQLTQDDLRWAELVLVLDEGHRSRVAGLDPAARGKVFLLGHFGVGAIPDPYGRSDEFWKAVVQLIDQSVSEWVARL